MGYILRFVVVLLLVTGISDLHAGEIGRKSTWRIEIADRQEATGNHVLVYTYSPAGENPSFRTATLYRANTDVVGLDVTRQFRYKAPVDTVYRGVEEIMLEAGRLEPGDVIEYEIGWAQPEVAEEDVIQQPVSLITNIEKAIYNYLSQSYTLYPDSSREFRYTMELQPSAVQTTPARYVRRDIIYNPQKQQLKIHKAAIRNKKGKEMPLPASAILEVLPVHARRSPAGSHLKEVIFVYENMEAGSRLLLDYSIVSEAGYLPKTDLCISLTPDFPVKDFTLGITVPDNSVLTYNLQGIPYKENRKKSMPNTVTLHIKDMPSSVCGEKMPLFTASSYPSTEKALENFYRQQFSRKGDLQLLTLAEALTEELQTEQEKITGLYTYVKEQIATSWLTLPETAFTLRTADEVINTAYGTIAEKANLLQGLLNALEIEATPVPLFNGYLPDNSFGLSSISGWTIEVLTGNETILLRL